MSSQKFKVEIHLQIDTEDWPPPADGQISLSLSEDIKDAIESTLPAEVNYIRAVKTGGKNVEIRNND